MSSGRGRVFSQVQGQPLGNGKKKTSFLFLLLIKTPEFFLENIETQGQEEGGVQNPTSRKGDSVSTGLKPPKQHIIHQEPTGAMYRCHTPEGTRDAAGPQLQASACMQPLRPEKTEPRRCRELKKARNADAPFSGKKK